MENKRPRSSSRGSQWVDGRSCWLSPEQRLSAAAISAQDKYTLQVPGGLSFSEFRGYEKWEVISTSKSDEVLAVTVGNAEMIKAYLTGIPDNGQPVPDGAKMAKIHWNLKKSEFFPDTFIPAAQRDADFMVKDSKRFADSGGWCFPVILAGLRQIRSGVTRYVTLMQGDYPGPQLTY